MKSLFNVGLAFIIGLTLVGGLGAMDLDEAVSLALKANLDLKVAKAEIEAAEREAKAAGRDFLPKLTFSASVLNQSDLGGFSFPMPVAGASDPSMPTPVIENKLTEHHLEEYTLTITQPLTPLYRIHSAYSLNRTKKEVADSQLRRETDRIIAETVNAYCQTLMSRKLVNLAKVNIEELQGHLRRVESLYKAGVVLKRDLLQVELGLEEAKLQLAVNQRQVTLSQIRLAQILSVSSEDLSLLEELPEFGLKSLELELLLAQAMAGRPEIGQADLSIQAARLQKRLSTADFIPDLAVYGSIKWQDGNRAQPEENQIVGLALNADLFEWGGRWERRQADAVRIQQAQAYRRAIMEKIKVEVTGKYNALLDAWDQLSVARKNLALAEESLRITQRQYETGRADITDLLNDQTVFHQARTNIEIARYHLYMAEAELQRSVAASR